jgi:adenosylmethionine-8-amino-7-oxononanoate aminotransferase
MTADRKKALQQKDRQFVWHPFAQMKDYENEHFPIIDKAKGLFLWDVDGNRYYDTNSSWWVCLHGHSHPRINEAIRRQLERLEQVNFGSFTHEPGIELAAELVSRTPEGLNKVFYSDNGSTAVEVALKMSFQYWQQVGRPMKSKFVYIENSYHGDTIGSVSVGGVDLYHKLYRPLLFETYAAPSPHVYGWARKHGYASEEMSSRRSSLEWSIAEDCVEQALSGLGRLLEEKHETISAVILEPMIQAAGGMMIHPASYVQGVRRLCDQYQVHLIADEVATGFGRTGKMFACEHADITPDFICLSKGLTAGYVPMAVTMTTDEIYQAFYDDYDKLKTFFHGHSFTGSPVAAAVALESLRIFDEESVLEKAQGTSAMLHREVQRFWNRPHVGDIRGIGHIAAIELVENPASGKTFPFERRMGREVFKAGLKEGLFLRPLGDLVYFWLPLSVTEEEIHDMVDRTEKVFERLGL